MTISLVLYNTEIKLVLFINMCILQIVNNKLLHNKNVSLEYRIDWYVHVELCSHYSHTLMSSSVWIPSLSTTLTLKLGMLMINLALIYN